MFFKSLILVLTLSLIGCKTLRSFINKEPEIVGAEDFGELEESGSKGSDTGNIEGLSTVFFDLDSSRVNASTQAQLDANIAWLKKNPNVKKIELEGHCDPLGSEAYNIGLGQRRAKQVRDYLIQKGISKDKLEIISFGEERLLSTVDNAKNRRVNFVPIY